MNNITVRIVPKHPAEQGLVLDSPMNEGGQTLVHDLSEHGEEGSIEGALFWTNGPRGQMLYYDFKTDTLNFGNHPQYDIPINVTMEAWINPRSIDTTGNWNRIIAKGANNQYECFVTHAANFGLGMRLWIGALQSHTSSVYPDLNTWSHFIAQYDGSNITMYLDGVLIKQAAQVGNIDPNAFDMMIGNWDDAVLGSWRTFEGSIQNARVYKTILSEEDRLRQIHRQINPLRCGA